MAPPPEGLKNYEFDWETLDVIIGGKSAIDGSDRLRVRTHEDAARYMECYGYDLENPIEKAELFGNFQESLSFIRRYFLQPDNLEGLKLEVPRKIAEINDVTQLILTASAPAGAPPAQTMAALWACAIMKVMHTVSHIDKDLRANYFTDIQKQILDRFYRFIFRDENGQVSIGKDARDPGRVDLVAFESKPKKGRDSVILKLLHKPENVAEDIFDRVGIRFVTRNRFDAVRVVKFLKDRYVVMPANIKPSRSKNTLVDTKAFSSEIRRLLADLDAGKLTAGDIDRQMAAFCESSEVEAPGQDNPHTSSHYRAIQFTCRQLVKIKNPIFDELKTIKGAMKGAPVPEELAKTIDQLDLRNIQKEIRFFFPFEVQIFDQNSHRENLAGRSSHANYKKSQIQAAMRRVLGELMRFAEA